MQCLSAFAEKVAATDDAAVAQRMGKAIMRCILQPEPGYQVCGFFHGRTLKRFARVELNCYQRLDRRLFVGQFEARHGTHVREVAAQALLKLCGTTTASFQPVQPSSNNGAMHSTFVTGEALHLLSTHSHCL